MLNVWMIYLLRKLFYILFFGGGGGIIFWSLTHGLRLEYSHHSVLGEVALAVVGGTHYEVKVPVFIHIHRGQRVTQITELRLKQQVHFLYILKSLTFSIITGQFLLSSSKLGWKRKKVLPDKSEWCLVSGSISCLSPSQSICKLCPAWTNLTFKVIINLYCIQNYCCPV